MKISRTVLILILIMVIGFGFRFYGIGYDNTCCQHPDERAIVMSSLPLTFPTSIQQFLSPESPLNPHFFAYGNLPMYLLKWAGLAATSINPIFAEYSYINYVGRFISIIADLVTIFLIFKIAEKIFNKSVGFAAAFVYSISVLPIQYSHFYTSDILLTMFTTLTLWRSIKFYNKPNFKNAILTGICFGLALSTKISSIPIVISITAALSADFILILLNAPKKIKHLTLHIPKFIKKITIEGLLILTAAMITFVLAQPYALIDWQEYYRQNLEQSRMTHDAYVFPYTLQYVGKIPYLHELKNMFMWGLGPVIFIFSTAGIYLIFKLFKTLESAKKAEVIIIASFGLLYFLTVGKFAVGFMRYLLPIYPIVALAAGIFLAHCFKTIDTFKNNNLKVPAKALIILLILIWPLTFSSIYSRTNTRIEATEWINENIPKGSVLTHEIWDDAIPMNNLNEYEFVDLGMYDQPDDRAKWETLSSKIKTADYLVFASNRLYTPIQNLSDCSKYRVCFPIASTFYNDVLSENGYEKVVEFTSFPTIPIFGIPIDDQIADESFTVYDHPKIQIFKINK